MAEDSNTANDILELFKTNNPQASIEVLEDKVKILTPWARKDAWLQFDKADTEFTTKLNQLKFNKKYDAIFHIEHKMYEFPYAFVKKGCVKSVGVEVEVDAGIKPPFGGG